MRSSGLCEGPEGHHNLVQASTIDNIQVLHRMRCKQAAHAGRIGIHCEEVHSSGRVSGQALLCDSSFADHGAWSAPPSD